MHRQIGRFIALAGALALATACGKGGGDGYIVYLDNASLPVLDCNMNEYDSGAGLPDPYVELHKNWVEDVWTSMHFEDEIEPVFNAPAFGSEVLSAEDLMSSGLRIMIWDEDGAVSGAEEIAQQVILFTQTQLDAGIANVAVSCVDVQLSLQ
jgi:hypothetical protein